MAKNRSVSRTTQRARDISSIAPQGRSFMPAKPVVDDFRFLPGADRRRFHFEKPLYRPLVYSLGEAQLTRQLYDSRLRFIDPFRVLVCARRKERREVLFARRSLGRGGRGSRSPLSKISCSRGGR